MSSYSIPNYCDTRSYADMISQSGLSKLPPLIITCAITGGVHGKESNPNLPELPEEQAQQAYDAYNAGASMIHIHARDIDNPCAMTQKWEDFYRINALVRDRCPDVIINNNLVGMRRDYADHEGNYRVSQQLLVSLKAVPEVGSVDLSTHCMNVKLQARKPPLFGRDMATARKEVNFMAYDDLENAIRLMREYGIKPELECFGLDGYQYVNYMIEKGLLDEPGWIHVLFGGSGAIPGINQLMTAGRILPQKCLLSIIGIGAAQTAILTQSILLGYHVRVGLEDNYYYGPGELAKSNAQMVERVVRIARELGREIATPEQAREMMGLGAPRRYD